MKDPKTTDPWNDQCMMILVQNLLLPTYSIFIDSPLSINLIFLMPPCRPKCFRAHYENMFVCGAWVKRGIAKETPDKVTLEEADLQRLLDETKTKLKDIGGEDINIGDIPEEPIEEKDEDGADISEGEGDEEAEDEVDADLEEDEVSTLPSNVDDEDAIREEYGLDDYDDEEGSLMTGAGMAGLMYHDSNTDDPYINVADLEEEERTDALIKPTDNLFVVGKVEEEYSCLDVFVYNEDEDSTFVHHDIYLDSFPLCLEWLSFDPCAEEKSGNYIAVGTMEPEIQVWDLDVIDTVEPVFSLGQKVKKKKKKGKKAVAAPAEKLTGHTDSVLSLSWNRNVKKILASGGADTTVLLWDMSQGSPVHTLKHHKDKVQSISWHPVEAQSLLTASFDKTAVVVDCRSPDVYKSWALTGECEQVLWDTFSPYNFFVSSDDGVVAYFDVRADTTPVFKINAHDQEVSGIALSKRIPGCLTTVSADEKVKVWSYKDNKPVCVLSRDMNMGGLNFVSACPDLGLTFAMGGCKEGLRMLNLLETSQGKEHFRNAANQSSPAAAAVPKDTPAVDTEMDAEDTTAALESLTLKKDAQETETVIVKRKKKTKKKK